MKYTTLTNDEKNKIREDIRAFMKMHPMRAYLFVEEERGQKSTGGFLAFFAGNGFAYAFSALLVVAAGGVWTSLAAEKSLPGDVLYPVKLSVNEKMKGGFAFSNEAKVRFESERIERRLEEAETLLAQDELDENDRMRLESNVAHHVENLQRGFKAIEDEGNIDAFEELSLKVESSFQAHGKMLSGITENNATGTLAATPLIESVGGEASRIAALRSEMQKKNRENIDDARIETYLDTRKNAAESAILGAEERIEKKSGELSAEANAEAAAGLEAARDLVSQADAMRAEGNVDGAFALYESALKAAHETRIFANTRARLNLDIRFSIGIPPINLEEENMGSENDDEDVEKNAEERIKTEDNE